MEEAGNALPGLENQWEQIGGREGQRLEKLHFPDLPADLEKQIKMSPEIPEEKPSGRVRAGKGLRVRIVLPIPHQDASKTIQKKPGQLSQADHQSPDSLNPDWARRLRNRQGNSGAGVWKCLNMMKRNYQQSQAQDPESQPGKRKPERKERSNWFV
jgi:hypothetical protein